MMRLIALNDTYLEDRRQSWGHGTCDYKGAIERISTKIPSQKDTWTKFG